MRIYYNPAPGQQNERTVELVVRNGRWATDECGALWLEMSAGQWHRVIEHFQIVGTEQSRCS